MRVVLSQSVMTLKSEAQARLYLWTFPLAATRCCPLSHIKIVLFSVFSSVLTSSHFLFLLFQFLPIVFCEWTSILLRNELLKTLQYFSFFYHCSCLSFLFSAFFPIFIEILLVALFSFIAFLYTAVVIKTSLLYFVFNGVSFAVAVSSSLECVFLARFRLVIACFVACLYLVSCAGIVPLWFFVFSALLLCICIFCLFSSFPLFRCLVSHHIPRGSDCVTICPREDCYFLYFCHISLFIFFFRFSVFIMPFSVSLS